MSRPRPIALRYVHALPRVVQTRHQSSKTLVKLASLHPAARMGEELGWGIELRPMDFCQAIREAEAARDK
jgi:hypothetical protein